MRTKDFFRQIRKEQREQTRLKEAIALRHMQLLPQAIRYDRDHVQSSPTDSMSETVAYIADQANKLEALSARLEERRSVAIRMIMETLESNEREVMLLYYIDSAVKLRTWQDVADEMGYSIETVHKCHKSALIKLDKISRD